MCLVTDKKPYITEEDLIVYKIVKNSSTQDIARSYFVNGFAYERGILAVMNQNNIENSSSLGKSFGTFDATEYYAIVNLDNRKCATYMEGFHFFLKERLILTPFFSYLLAEFIIPKGSWVVMGYTGLGVTNQIIYNRLVNSVDHKQLAVVIKKDNDEDDSLPSDSLSHVSEPE